MSVVDKYTLSEGLLGTRMIGAVMAGHSEIYVRFEQHSFTTPGVFSFTLPDWATGYGVVMSGGGGGGRCGDGGNGAQGYGGRGGDVVGIWGRLSNANNMVMSGVVGAGGAGGRGGSYSLFGETGGTTSITTHTSNVYSAAGGTGNPTSGMTNGGTTTEHFSDLLCRYFNAQPGSSFTNGPGGTGNAGSGTRGGGGAGGNGGYFGSYYYGGKGGDGFVEIYVWGLPRHQGGTEQILLGTDLEARNQFRSALSARGYNYQTIKHIPFDIELVGTGSARELFRGCASLESVPEMNTSGVTNMRSMFYDCSSLVHVPEMDTSQVTEMRFMYYNCPELMSVPPMDTSRVTLMNSMFNDCSTITTVPPMDTSQVTDMSFMFNRCSSLTTVPPMDTSRVTNTRTMFQHCTSLVSVPDLDTAQVTDMGWMFYNCSALTDGNVRLFGRHPHLITTSMIYGSGLTRLPFYDAAGNPDDTIPDVGQITLGTDLEARDQLRAALSSRGLDYQTVEEIPFAITLVGTGSARDLFRDYAALTTVPPIDTSGVTNMRSMFNACNALATVPEMDTSQVTDMSWMFTHCYALTSIPEMDTSQVTTMSNMFDYSLALTSVPDLDTSQVTNVNQMFYGCSLLTDGNVHLIGKHPDVSTTNMIEGSGLTREPWYNADGTPLGPREVTITTGDYTMMGFDKSTATGDTSLIGGWPEQYGEYGVSFTAPVTCNLRVNNIDTYSRINAGTTIPSGTGVIPTSTGTFVVHVFTEVL